MAISSSVPQLLPPLTSVTDLDGPFHLAKAIFLAEVERRGYRKAVVDTQAIGTCSDPRAMLEAIGEVLCDVRLGHSVELVIRTQEAVVKLSVSAEQVAVQAAGHDRGVVDALVALVHERLPEPEDMAVTTPITFWTGCDNGCPHPRHRRIDARPWPDVVTNYPRPILPALDRLMDTKTPNGGGRMLVWHGPPGTGKTTALRALAHEWRDWCAVHCILDPERFLGRDTLYLLDVLGASDFEDSSSREWRLVVLEDSGELISSDARSRAGQAVSRVLNATDGLLGHGSNTLMLVTTNEPIGRLHPAITRDGRCLSQIEFGMFSTDEANAWLERSGSERRVSSPTTLAGLYAVSEGRDGSTIGQTDQATIGFTLPASAAV